MIYLNHELGIPTRASPLALDLPEGKEKQEGQSKHGQPVNDSHLKASDVRSRHDPDALSGV
jgi:hypothetical protein